MGLLFPTTFCVCQSSMQVLLALLALNAAVVDRFFVNAAAVQCNATYSWYEWAFDVNDDDPCQLATRLYSSCAPNANPLQPLSYSPSGPNFYAGPQTSTQSVCTCSYVMYNLLSACSDCQVGLLAPAAWPSYEAWAESCDLSNIGGLYPDSIPSELTSSIPIWARFSTADTGDPHWSYGLSKGVATGHFLVNNKLVATVQAPDSSSCSYRTRVALPVGTAFAGVAVGILISSLAFLLYRKRVSRIIPPPTRYHTTPDNTPLHPLLPRAAYSQGTSFLRRILEQQQHESAIIEPFDVSTAAANSDFPPHPAVHPPRRGHTFPPMLTIALSSPGPSRQPSIASFHSHPHSQYVYTPNQTLRHSRSMSYGKPSPTSMPPTSVAHSPLTPYVGPSTFEAQNGTEPPASPVPPDQHWPEPSELPPAYRRKS